jgi:hypothetical protein
MISGVYLGEIARLVLQGMAQESDVFGSSVDLLSTPFIFRYHIILVSFSSYIVILQINFFIYGDSLASFL